jgi:predicted ABC-type ATPase
LVVKSLAPKVVLLAGPNGAGKSTMAGQLLKGTLGVDDFVNADVIARGLSSFSTLLWTGLEQEYAHAG